MTSSQREEVKRLTPNMWDALRYAARCDGLAEVGGLNWMRTANILARRGFCTLTPIGNGWHRIKLTEAGAQALAKKGNSK